MSKVVGSITGANKAEKGAKRAAQMAQFSDFFSATPFGQGGISKTGGLNYGGGPGAGLASGFEGFTGNILQQMMGMGPQNTFNLDPNQVFGAGLGAGQAYLDTAAGQATPYLQGGQNFLSALTQFNPDQFAQAQFDRLENLARPGEQTQTQSALQNLFSRGRLGAGDTAGSQLLGQLNQSQLMARDNRALQALGLAQSEQQNLAGLATGLTGQGFGALGFGEQLASSELGRFLSSLQGGQSQGGFQQQLMQSLLQQALGGAGGIQQSLMPTQMGIQNMLAAGGLVNNADATAASYLSGGANAAASAHGNLMGSLIGAVGGSKFVTGG
jgi:hypothetical protein